MFEGAALLGLDQEIQSVKSGPGVRIGDSWAHYIVRRSNTTQKVCQENYC